MSLSRIPSRPTMEKSSITMQVSTWQQLAEYVRMCEEQANATVPRQEVLEQMLLDFMARDKEFQQYLKRRAKPAKPATVGQPEPIPARQDVDQPGEPPI